MMNATELTAILHTVMKAIEDDKVAALIPRKTDSRPDQPTQFTLAVGTVVGGLGLAIVRDYLKQRGVTDEEMKSLEKAAMKVAEGFYDRPVEAVDIAAELSKI